MNMAFVIRAKPESCGCCVEATVYYGVYTITECMGFYHLFLNTCDGRKLEIAQPQTDYIQARMICKRHFAKRARFLVKTDIIRECRRIGNKFVDVADESWVISLDNTQINSIRPILPELDSLVLDDL